MKTAQRNNYHRLQLLGIVAMVLILLLLACSSTDKPTLLTLKCGGETLGRFFVHGGLSVETASILRSACAVAVSRGSMVVTCPCNLTSTDARR